MTGNQDNKMVIEIEVDTFAGSHIDSILEELYKMATDKNKNYTDRVFVYTTKFNGHTIKSLMSVDEVYQMLFNCTKQEWKCKETDIISDYDVQMKEKREQSVIAVEHLYSKLTKHQQENFDKIDWKHYIGKSIYGGREFVVALQFTDLLNQNETDAAAQLYDDEWFSGASLSLVECIIKSVDPKIYYQFIEIIPFIKYNRRIFDSYIQTA